MYDWSAGFIERELAEIEFAKIYTEKFNHGTDGHNRLNIVTKLALLVNEQQEMIRNLTQGNN